MTAAVTAMRLVGDDGSRSITRRVSLTKMFIEKLTCPPDRRAVVVYDDSVRSLCIHVTRTSKSFYVYRKSHGRPLRYKLGSFPELSVDVARKRAMKDLGEIVQGKDPREERKAIRESVTLQDLFERWEKGHANLRHTAKTRVTDKSRFETCFGNWKARKIGTIKEQHVRSKHAELAEERGHVTANRAIQLLRRLFNFARLQPNPAGNKAVQFFAERPRSRYLLGDELPKFFKALNDEPNEAFRDFFQLALLTGARRGNVQSMRWDEVKLRESTWIIPAEKSKNHEPVYVHLVDVAKAILERRLRDAQRRKVDGDERYGEWVFPSKRFDARTPHLTEAKGAWERVLARAKIKNLRVHDLRRTLGSYQAIGGASLPIIGKSLGHGDGSEATAIYARLQLDPVRASVNAAASAILAAGNAESEAQRETISVTTSSP
jgi:integrase